MGNGVDSLGEQLSIWSKFQIFSICLENWQISHGSGMFKLEFWPISHGASAEGVLFVVMEQGLQPSQRGAPRQLSVFRNVEVRVLWGLMNKTKYGCATARNNGTCKNRRLIAREDVGAHVLGRLRTKQLDLATLTEFVAEYGRRCCDRRHRDTIPCYHRWS